MGANEEGFVLWCSGMIYHMTLTIGGGSKWEELAIQYVLEAGLP
jgi:hypothetical protein